MLVLFDDGYSISETPFNTLTKNKNPGWYAKGFSCLEAKLEPGNYTVALWTEDLSIWEKYRIVFNLMENQNLTYMEDLVIKDLMT